MNQKNILLLVLCLCVTIVQAQKKPRYALVIGNATYKTQGTLKNPVNDAMLIRDKLENCGFRVICKTNLTRPGFDSAIATFNDSIRRVDCEALFYYSGHGIQSGGENYLIPVDATLSAQSDVKYQCIPLDGILDLMNDSRSGANIIIMDACRNNPFTRSWSRNVPLDKGLKAVSATPKESFIFYATAQNEVAADGSGVNSPFTTAFAKHVSEPGLSINQLLIRIINDVMAQYPRQRPWGSMSIKNEFYFVAPSGSRRDSGHLEYQPVVKDRATLVFSANEKCSITINEDREVIRLESFSFGDVERPFGVYRIRAESINDPTIWIDTTLEVTEAKQYRLSFDITRLVTEKRHRVEKDPVYLAEMAVVDEIRRNMAEIEAGKYNMGYRSGNNDESPEHTVSIDKFHISRFEVTQKQWRIIMRTDPSVFKFCDECPIENISWFAADSFISRLNVLSGGKYRLPTEAEWEYVARGGNLASGHGSRFAGGARSENVGWTFKNSGKQTHPKASLAANEKGLFDMTGNVAEWCSDFYDPKYFSSGDRENPAGPKSKDLTTKVVRGGSWNDDDMNCRNSARSSKPPQFRSSQIGFRIAMSD